ncbi:MAG TPA: hypothetical protein VGF67_14120, partial [Ktedonobacteraceae bacterium]
LLARRPGGWVLSQKGRAQDLGEVRRPLWRSLFYRSTLSSQELETTFDFCGARFVLLFKRDLHFMTLDTERKVSIQRGTHLMHIQEGEGSTELEDGDVLLIERCTPAVFKRNV